MVIVVSTDYMIQHSFIGYENQKIYKDCLEISRNKFCPVSKNDLMII